MKHDGKKDMRRKLRGNAQNMPKFIMMNES